MNFIKLIRSKKSIFTIDDLKLILDTTNENTIRNYLTRANAKGLVENIYYGIWKLKDKDINIYEFATKLKSKSYISFETVLQKEAVIFQDYSNTVFLATDNSLEKKALGKVFKFNKIKASILLDPIGINHMGNYAIASLERAICDRIYLSKNYYFDDLSRVDFDKLESISKIYNKRVILEINKLKKNYVK